MRETVDYANGRARPLALHDLQSAAAPEKGSSCTWYAQVIDGITPILITFNEAPNIARTLDKLTWARRIVLVDSGSTDGTLEILARYPRIALFSRAFDNFADQCNFGLAQVQTKWALSLDADYELSDH